MKLGTLPLSDLLELSDDIYKSTVITAQRAKQIIQKRYDEKASELEMFDEEYTPAMLSEVENYTEKTKPITKSVNEFMNKELTWKVGEDK
tara:strand:- start:151 stop:420 length:270 start_codon:yes stop_codon:yes gene_type:complete